MANRDILIEEKEDGLRLSLPHSLDSYSIGAIWDQAIDAQRTFKPKTLIIDASATEYCDSAGIALLTELDKLQHLEGHRFEVTGLAADIQSLLNILTSNKDAPPEKPTNPKILVKLGLTTVKMLQDIHQNLAFLGELCVALIWLCTGKQGFRWQSFWTQVNTIGPQALAISALLGFVMGLILSFQALLSLDRFGATIYTINLVVIGLTRELGALLTALILAGRTASSFAAEIGTMKINQEIDALMTMGIKPMSYLVLPRVIAGILIAPLLTLYLIFFGFLGCYLVMCTENYSLIIFVSQLVKALHLSDLWIGLLKATIFGVIVMCIGCIYGLRTKSHAAALGASTTGAVVSSIVMIAIADGLLTIILYVT